MGKPIKTTNSGWAGPNYIVNCDFLFVLLSCALQLNKNMKYEISRALQLNKIIKYEKSRALQLNKIMKYEISRALQLNKIMK